jgi:regulator of protease activity HflC (stomatin/prohibitin superfamily)
VIRALLALALLAGACTNPDVPAGHEGYVYEKPLWFGKMEFRKTLTGPASTGLSWRLFVINIDMQAKNYNEKFELLTSDNLKVAFEVNIRIQPRHGQVKPIVEDWGGDKWYEWNVKEQLRTIVRNQLTKYSAKRIQLETPEVKQAIEKDMHAAYDATPFEILSVDIGEIVFPERVAQAINAKIAMLEELKRQDTVLDTARKEAANKVLAAIKVAEQQRIITSTLDPMFVQREAVEAYGKLAASKVHTVIVLPNTTDGTGLPLVAHGGARKVLTAEDQKLLADMEAKYMAIIQNPDNAPLPEPTVPTPAPPTPAPSTPAPPKPAPAAPTPPAPTPTTPPQKPQ